MYIHTIHRHSRREICIYTRDTGIDIGERDMYIHTIHRHSLRERDVFDIGMVGERDMYIHDTQT